MGKELSLAGYDDWIRLIGSAIPLAIQSATLVRVVRGSQHKFAIRILAMLIGYNLTNIVIDILYLNMTANSF